MLSKDQFGHSFQIKLDADVDALPSAAGVFFTILLIIIVGCYGVQKFEILVNKKDADIMSVE